MIQGTLSQKFANRRLQERLDERLARTPFHNIRLKPSKTEFMHLIAYTANGRSKNSNTARLCIYDSDIPPTHTIRSLGVIIDRRHSFKQHMAGASVRL